MPVLDDVHMQSIRATIDAENVALRTLARSHTGHNCFLGNNFFDCHDCQLHVHASHGKLVQHDSGFQTVVLLQEVS